MSSLLVQVVKIESIEKHPNADTLWIARMEGFDWNCIVKEGQFKVGDVGIYIPIDALVPDKLADEYRLDYLRHGSRVRSVKLRGYVSQGLLINIPPYLTCKLGDDVADELGIEKWEPPTPSYQRVNNFGGGKRSKKRPNSNFRTYTGIENIKNYPSIFKEDDDVIVTEKVHGCLQKKTKILLSDGTTRTIGDIVANKLSLEVLGLNEQGDLCPSKITGWFTNGATDTWLKVIYKRKGFGALGGHWYGSLVCTPEHRLLVNGVYVMAKDLTIGSKLTRVQHVSSLTYIQESVLTGVMLGDGSFSKIGESTAAIEFGHKKEYEVVGTEPVTISSTQNKQYSKIKYDIETETHNFIANGIVVHNSNFRAGWVPIELRTWWDRIKLLFIGKHEYLVGSHKVQLALPIVQAIYPRRTSYYKKDVYNQIASRYKLKDILPKGYVLYGEIYGPGIQDLTYGLDDIDVVFFDLMVDGKYVDYDVFFKFCSIRHLPTVPLLHAGKYNDRIPNFANGKSMLAPKQIREGVVIKAAHETNDSRVGRKILKCVSEDYYVRKNGTEFQ